MRRLHRILVPTDLGEPSRAALAYAVELARAVDAQVSLLHVYPPISSMADWLGVPAGRGRARRRAEQEDARVEALHRALESFARSVPHVLEVRVRLVVRSGEPEVEIAACAEEDGEDLILLGVSRPVGGLAHRLTLQGAVAERVLQLAPCPVLVLRNDERRQAVAEPLGQLSTA